MHAAGPLILKNCSFSISYLQICVTPSGQYIIAFLGVGLHQQLFIYKDVIIIILGPDPIAPWFSRREIKNMGYMNNSLFIFRFSNMAEEEEWELMRNLLRLMLYGKGRWSLSPPPPGLMFIFSCLEISSEQMKIVLCSRGL